MSDKQDQTEAADGQSELTDGLATQTFATPRDMRPVSIETMTQAMREIGPLPKPDQWILVDPHGRMYKGTVEQMTRLLLQEHPLVRTPFAMTGG